MILSRIYPEDFDSLYDLIESSFPFEERPTRDEGRIRFGKEEFSAYALLEDGERVGFITVWQVADFHFIEHFVIYSEYRNRGYGAAAISAAIKLFPRMVLEAEPHDGDVASRRLAFYERCGFVINDFPYMQPSYHGGEGVRLQLLSYPEPLETPESVAARLYKTVYGREYTTISSLANEITVRPLSLDDDLSTVAKLIYYTDDYIFPYLFGDDFKKSTAVLLNMIRSDTVYNYSNITVATVGDFIAGIVIAKKTPLKISFSEIASAFIDAGELVDERVARVFDEYYNLLNNEPEGVYVANVCVDSAFRNMGVGRKMLEGALPTDETCHLETVKANISAFKLYTRIGFKVDYEYPGFSDVPCYRMRREKTTKQETVN